MKFIVQIHLEIRFGKSVQTAGSLWGIWRNIFTFIKTQLSLAIINAGTIEDLLQLQSSDSVLWIVKNLPGV